MLSYPNLKRSVEYKAVWQKCIFQILNYENCNFHRKMIIHISFYPHEILVPQKAVPKIPKNDQDCVNYILKMKNSEL